MELLQFLDKTHDDINERGAHRERRERVEDLNFGIHGVKEKSPPPSHDEDGHSRFRDSALPLGEELEQQADDGARRGQGHKRPEHGRRRRDTTGDARGDVGDFRVISGVSRDDRSRSEQTVFRETIQLTEVLIHDTKPLLGAKTTLKTTPFRVNCKNRIKPRLRPILGHSAKRDTIVRRGCLVIGKLFGKTTALKSI